MTPAAGIAVAPLVPLDAHAQRGEDQPLGAQTEAPPWRLPSNGVVQIDDAYLGGEINGAKAGRGSPNTQAFLIAVQTDKTLEQVQYAVGEPVPTSTASSPQSRHRP